MLSLKLLIDEQLHDQLFSFLLINPINMSHLLHEQGFRNLIVTPYFNLKWQLRSLPCHNNQISSLIPSVLGETFLLLEVIYAHDSCPVLRYDEIRYIFHIWIHIKNSILSSRFHAKIFYMFHGHEWQISLSPKICQLHASTESHHCSRYKNVP